MNRDPGEPSAPAFKLRRAELGLVFASCLAIVGVDLYLIQSGPARVVASTTVPVTSAATEALARPEAALLHPSPADSSAPGIEVDAGAAEASAERTAAEEPPPGEEPPQPDKRRDRKALGTVDAVAKRACSTAPVEGLSRQIIDEARRIDASAFARVPARKNLETAGHVFLYLDAPARDHLLKVLDAHPDRVMKVHSALRTVAQQYLLSRWSAEKRCGIQLATRPGESNHETGLALDIGGHAAWQAALESEGFHWLGAIDRVHFDFGGPGATHHDGLDVRAFQRLWNKNHPGDAIAETGRYDVATEVRLKRSPAAGFSAGTRRGKAPDDRPTSGGGSTRAHAR